MTMTAKNIPAKNVDEYMQALPSAVRTTLEKVRQTIIAAAPEAEEVISYQIPTYKYKGALIHFAAFKNHCGLYAVSKNILKVFEKELWPYVSEGTTIRFTTDKPLPASLLKKIVRARIKENEERDLVKKKRSNGKKN